MRFGLALSIGALVARGLSADLNSDLAATSVNETVSTTSTSSAGYGCPKFSPGPVGFNWLAGQFPSPAIVDAEAIEAIRQTLAVYAFAIDGRNFEVLRNVFTTNVRANYSDPIGVLNGVQAIINTLPPGLSSFASTQHLYGSQYIYVCAPNAAVSVTYFQASHFFVPYTGIGNTIDNSKVLIDRAQYQDVWAKQRDGTWKITNRNLVRMVSGILSPRLEYLAIIILTLMSHRVLRLWMVDSQQVDCSSTVHTVLS